MFPDVPGTRSTPGSNARLLSEAELAYELAVALNVFTIEVVE